MTELRPDISAAKDRMRARFGAGREIKKLTDHLWEGEQVQAMTSGAYGRGTGLVVLTDRRLLFVQDGVLSKTTEDFPLSKVSSVQWSSGLALGTVVVFASGNKAEIKNVQKDDGKAIVDAMRDRLSRADAPTTAAPDVAGQLRQLGELRDAGVLTAEEFAAKKAEILARL